MIFDRSRAYKALLIICTCLTLSAMGGGERGKTSPFVVKKKADSATEKLQTYLAGKPPAPPVKVITLMKSVRTDADAGRLDKANATLDKVHVMLDALIAQKPTPVPGKYFTNPRKVTIRGYDQDIMEPFMSRDGRFLFFNNLNHKPVNTNIFYAKRIDDYTFQFMGEVKGINTKELEGVASMDRNGQMYFTTGRSYGRDYVMTYTTRFQDGRVTKPQPVPGISRKQKYWMNMDSEISADGKTLYSTDTFFQDYKPPPRRSNIIIARKQGNDFTIRPDSATITKNLNSENPEYAVAISKDEKEIFFTRGSGFGTATPATEIFRARRNSVTEPFGKPERLHSIQGVLTEAPTLSADENLLYYHKKDGTRFALYVVHRIHKK